MINSNKKELVREKAGSSSLKVLKIASHNIEITIMSTDISNHQIY